MRLGQEKQEPQPTPSISPLRRLDSRQRSLAIVHLSMLIFSLGNSIIFTGVWPYLRELDATVTIQQYGFVVAADAFGQMIFSPIFGFLADKCGSIRPVCLLCCIVFTLGNVLYATISFIPDSLGTMTQARMYGMLLSRFVVGIGTAINAASRSYVSKATFQDERTTHISLLSLFQTLGFVLGPAIQTALTPIGEKHFIGPDSHFVFDMFTATGWVSATTGLLAFILFLPGIFVEHSCLHMEAQRAETLKAKAAARSSPNRQKSLIHNPKKLLRKISSVSPVDGQLLEKLPDNNTINNGLHSGSTKSELPNMLATIASTYNFFSFLFNFVLLETIMTPLAIDQWGWTEENAILYLGIIMVIGGVLSGVCYACLGPLANKYDERLLLLLAGLIPMIIGRVCMFPLGNEYLPRAGGNSTVSKDFYNITVNTDANNSRVRASPVVGLIGCNYEWCSEIPKVTLAQFLVGYVFATVGYPFCMGLTGALFSKVLGPIPQGFWMGILTTSGSVARVVGPIFVSFIYEKYGTWLLFGLVALSLALSFIVTVLAYRQLVPYDLSVRNRPFLQQIQFWKGWTGIRQQQPSSPQPQKKEMKTTFSSPPTSFTSSPIKANEVSNGDAGAVAAGRRLENFQSITEESEE